MARKLKTKTQTEVQPKTVPEKPKIDAKYINEQGCLQLSGELFYKWKAGQATVERIRAQIQLLQRDIDNFLSKTENIAFRSWLLGRDSLLSSLSAAANEYKQIQDEVSTAIQQDLRECSIDDNTGSIFVFSSDTKQDEPVKITQ
jgi:tetrahydromethanopterin S-methyltransferase subunit F